LIGRPHLHSSLDIIGGVVIGWDELVRQLRRHSKSDRNLGHRPRRLQLYSRQQHEAEWKGENIVAGLNISRFERAELIANAISFPQLMTEIVEGNARNKKNCIIFFGVSYVPICAASDPFALTVLEQFSWN
jgi:hypothetical protein